MPAYLCHLCTTYNPFPSPLCQNCTHPYCIICLPIIPSPQSSVDSSTSSDSSISSFTLEAEEEELKDEDIIREFMSIHPAHRLTRPPSLDEVVELVGLGSGVIGAEVVVIDATPTRESMHVEISDFEFPSTTPLPLDAKTSAPPPPQQSYHARLSASIPVSTNALLSPPSHTAPLTRPIITRTMTEEPATEKAPLTSPWYKSHHKRHSSIPEIIASEGDHLKRTMSVQGEKVRGLVRMGSMRLREVVKVGGMERGRWNISAVV
ncbi:MAG: hypothetical protein Q9209_002438 [Squamulea sp. 1 TL-2023]